MNDFKDNFSKNEENNLIYEQEKVPIFQNKIYAVYEDALNAPYGKVVLAQSQTSGFMYNSNFNPDLMHYDVNYQNEQANSGVFQRHLECVIDLLKSFGIANKKIVEIGCGKGVFFEKMLEEGFDCLGFDPTYEGQNPKIIKDYFTEKFNNINAEVILMRHTLEHIPNPFSFIHEIAKANNYTGFLFVEVPTFDWIIDKKAFWDIFYEHCNYFTQQSLCAMFEDAMSGDFFGGQYIYLWADLSKLRANIPQQNFRKHDKISFEESIFKVKNILAKSPSVSIWGAGAKGSTFLNLLDPTREVVKYVIDINPAKQFKYIACTGHQIYPPNMLYDDPVETIIVMNENYIEEIKQQTNDLKINILSL